MLGQVLWRYLGSGTHEPGEPLYVCLWGGGVQYHCDPAIGWLWSLDRCGLACRVVGWAGMGKPGLRNSLAAPLMARECPHIGSTESQHLTWPDRLEDSDLPPLHLSPAHPPALCPSYILGLSSCSTSSMPHPFWTCGSPSWKVGSPYPLT